MSKWFWVFGPDGINTKIPATDADHAVQIVATITKGSTKDFQVFAPSGTQNKYSEHWHMGQVL